jgi:aspartate carbamoyltransferase catalytic subunit
MPATACTSIPQALLDPFTIREHKEAAEGLKVNGVGDLLHSRVLRSNIHLLTKMGFDVWVCGPPTLMPTGIRAIWCHADEPCRGRGGAPT